MDPEVLLNNLGFGGAGGFDDSMIRVPDRFIHSQMQKQQEDLQEFLQTHPEYKHLIPSMASSPVQGPGSFMQRTSPDTEEPAYRDSPDGAENQSPISQGQCNDRNLNIDQGYIETSDEHPNLNKTFEHLQDSCMNDQEGSGMKSDVKNSSKLLELCGIVPERYLIKSGKVVESDSNTDGTVAVVPLSENSTTKENRETADIYAGKDNGDRPKVSEHPKGGNIVVEAEVHAEVQSGEDNSLVASSQAREVTGENEKIIGQ